MCTTISYICLMCMCTYNFFSVKTHKIAMFPEIFSFLKSSENIISWAIIYIYYKTQTQSKLSGGEIWSQAEETLQNSSFHVKFRTFATIFQSAISSSSRLCILRKIFGIFQQERLLQYLYICFQYCRQVCSLSGG